MPRSQPRPTGQEPAGFGEPTVGLLSVGAERSGITVYNSRLAALLSERGHRVVCVRASLTGRATADLVAFQRAVHGLAGCDVVVTSYSRYQWAPEESVRIAQALTFAVATRSRGVVILHDVDDSHRWGAGTPYRRPHAESVVLSILLRAAMATVVHTQLDRSRLTWSPRHGLSVIPHIIEEPSPADRTAARDRFATGPGIVVCVLGFVHERKDPLLAVQVLAELPADTLLWFAGEVSSGSSVSRDDILADARRRGLGDRVTVTGYLSDSELAARVSAADVGLCLFREMSASGSLAMWLAARTPVVCRDIPGMHEFATLAPTVVVPAQTDSPADVARSILDVCARDIAESDFRAVLDDRSPEVVGAEMHDVVRAVARRRRHQGAPS